MITVEKPNTVVTSGIKDAVSFGIKQEGLAHIFGVLRNQLYSDKVLAVIREYTCNAVDAHTEAGKGDLPIEVTMPTRWNTMFKVRDFGSGLTDGDIHDIYAFYGESTKRKSNQLIGQLGLGSKSAFAYGDNFVITSYVDGVKNTYNAFIDASQVGQIAKLASEPSNEQNGVEISIAVRDVDIDTFHRKAYALFRYFKVRPVVKGANFTYESKVPIMKGADWAVYGANHPTVAIMGNIGYPIANHWNEETITSTLAAGLEVSFNIGDLEISASREQLQYTDRTKKAIKDKLVRVVKEVSDELNTRFKSCATLFDAHMLYSSVMDYNSNLYALRGMIKDSMKFNGKNIRSHDLGFQNPKDGEFSMKRYEKTMRGGSIKAYSYSHIICDWQTVLVDNDLMISSGINNRVWNLVTVDQRRVYVLSYRTPQDKINFLNDSGLVESNFIKLSSLPKISLAQAVGASPKNSKHASKEFSFDTNFSAGSYHRRYSDYWMKETIDVTTAAGIYVIIDGFRHRDEKGSLSEPKEIADILKSMSVFGITVPKIYGFKVAKEQEAKDNPNMVLFWDFLAEQLTEYFDKNKVAQKVANRLEYDNVAHHFSWNEFAERNAKKVSNKTCFHQTAELFSYMKHESDRKILDLAVGWQQYFKVSCKPEHDLSKLGKKVNSTYPLFESIRYWEHTKQQTDATVQYINLIDG